MLKSETSSFFFSCVTASSFQCYLNNTEYEEAFIVYENKDNQTWKEYRLERDPDLWGKMVEMCQAVMSEEVLPEDWKCTGPPWCVCKGVDQ